MKFLNFKLTPESREVIGLTLILTTVPISIIISLIAPQGAVCHGIIQLITGISLFNQFDFLKVGGENVKEIFSEEKN